MKITKSQLKQIVIEESQAVISKRECLLSQRVVMLAESRRIDKLHEEILNEIEIGKFLKQELPHLVLDIAGLVPGIGEAADLANAALYISKGEYLMAGFSVVSMIPAIGDFVGKGGKVLVKYGDDAGELTLKLGKAIREKLPEITKLFDKLRDNRLVGEYVDDMLKAVKEYSDDAIRGAAEAGSDVFQKTQHALQTATVTEPPNVTVDRIKDFAKKAQQRTTARRNRERIAQAFGGETQDEEQ